MTSSAQAGPRRITIRVTPELHERAVQVADEKGVSLNRLVVEAIEASVTAPAREAEGWPLEALTALLAPAADAADLTMDDLQRHVRDVRRRIWVERYEAGTRASGPGPV